MRSVARMHISRIMRKSFPTLKVTDTIDKVFRTFKTYSVGVVPVFEGERFVGEVCLQDLMKLVVGAAGFSADEISKDGMGIDTSFIAQNVEELMRRHETTVSSDTSVAEVAHIMLSDDVGAVIVMDKERVIGVVSEGDIVRKVLEKR